MNMPNLPEVSCLEDLLVVVFVMLASRGSTLSKVCNFQMPWCLGDDMTTSPVKFFTSARDLTGSFVQAFVSLSRSKQGKAVITVRCRAKCNEND